MNYSLINSFTKMDFVLWKRQWIP